MTVMNNDRSLADYLNKEYFVIAETHSVGYSRF